MNKEEIKEKTEKIFTFLYREGVYKSFRFPKGYGASVMDKFADDIIKRENGMVSLGFLVDFCIHQAHLWRDHKRWNNFSITWAFGPKAIDRFYSAKKGVRFYQDQWLKENGFDREELKCKFVSFKEHPLKKFIYIEAEDITKRKLLNNEAGKMLCFALTTLYSPNSPACQICKFSTECSKLLMSSNHELYRLRLSNIKNK